MNQDHAADQTPDKDTRVRDLLTQPGLSLTPSEAKIVQVLLADYPIGGLGTAANLAKRAGVSDPTVVRLVTKIGFDGFAEFQTKLLEEVEARLRSPLMMMEAKRPSETGNSVAQTYLRSAAEVVDKTAAATLPHAFDRAVELILGAKGEVFVLGGRFSRHVAGMLAGYLGQLRAGVVSLGALTAERFDALIDIDRRDVLIVFDYRRYQKDVIRFAEQSAGQGAHIVLFTDPWLSPIAEWAEVVIMGSGEVDSPYDSLAPAVAQIEALVVHALARETGAMRKRIQELEGIRSSNAITVGDPEQEKPDDTTSTTRRR